MRPLFFIPFLSQMTLPYQKIKDMIQGKNPMIFSKSEISEKQIQPASLDLTLGDRVYRTSSSFLPKPNESIWGILQKRTLYDFELKPETILEPNSSYIIPLNEYVDLAPGIYAYVNPKSSIGRVGLFVRLLVDGTPRFDYIPSGYKGQLYLEVIPLDFVVKIHPSLACNQVRFRTTGEYRAREADIRLAHTKYGVLFTQEGISVPQDDLVISDGGLMLTVDLESRDVVGYRAKHDTTKAIDLGLIDEYEPSDFWEPIARPQSGELILVPNDFYLLSSIERITFPPMFAGEMASYDPSSGEMRSHYAGFFDPGWGFGEAGEGAGTPAVLEVRAHNVPFRLTRRQIICTMVYENMLEQPQELYSSGLGSSYTGTGPKLSKHFKQTWN
ncbi:2'-deoxycytidine 5'-triphosphate deaminase [bacterium]|jgi:dCTP deaminase|nr:2'-deoxycytidine 5'-triphosphate deaminase [bacterium]MDP6756318.1 2'-deoxycytidine 5'-triphosphate deaminase [Patescibacteria group bacterium]|tara:strand:- start:9259 stop:10413 length:1155 start_codon:yes stop_codon:yes gene_type:complete